MQLSLELGGVFDTHNAVSERTELEFLKSVKTKLVPLTDMVLLTPAKTFKKVQSVVSTRPVRHEEMLRHLKRFHVDGILPLLNVVLYTEGKGSSIGTSMDNIAFKPCFTSGRTKILLAERRLLT
jgi:hypothetical protein